MKFILAECIKQINELSIQLRLITVCIEAIYFLSLYIHEPAGQATHVTCQSSAIQFTVLLFTQLPSQVPGQKWPRDQICRPDHQTLCNTNVTHLRHFQVKSNPTNLDVNVKIHFWHHIYTLKCIFLFNVISIWPILASCEWGIIFLVEVCEYTVECKSLHTPTPPPFVSGLNKNCHILVFYTFIFNK